LIGLARRVAIPASRDVLDEVLAARDIRAGSSSNFRWLTADACA
jgi:hypothetical protein